jgi:hypothetical protein
LVVNRGGYGRRSGGLDPMPLTYAAEDRAGSVTPCGLGDAHVIALIKLG